MLMLASASPRRAELLRQLGVMFQVLPDCAVDETRLPAETPFDYVTRLARCKAEAGQRQMPGSWVLGADTSVVIHGQVLGKPADDAQAGVMLAQLAGGTHQVLTGVCLWRDGVCHAQTVTTQVTFADLSPAQIDAYLDTGEWRGKAGGYAVQGFAAAFVAHLDGSYSNVVGLPLYETAVLLARAGIAFWQDTPCETSGSVSR